MSRLTCPYCGQEYNLNFRNGSSREHCSMLSCIGAFRRESDERNRAQTLIRMRAVRRMVAGVAV